MPPRPVNPNAIQPAQRGVGKQPLVAGTGAGQGMHASHRHTDEYMRSMYAALEDMGVDTADDLYRDAFDPACSTVGAAQGQPAIQRGPAQKLPRGAASGAYGNEITILPSSGWNSGPIEQRGRVANVSDRPLLCMSVYGDLAVVGSADHGLIEVELKGSGRDTTAPLRTRRTLYTKAYGHAEWVADVAHLPDGRVLSAGMDSKVCLWTAAGAPKCIDLLGHTGSVSKVLGSADGTVAISASYDKTVRLWSTSNGKELAKLRAHRGPIMHLAWASGGVLASADRDGAVVCWDVASGDATNLGAHQGHATALAAAGADGGSGGGQLSGGTLLSGGQDGIVRLWDLRQARSACETRVHTGAVNDLLAHRLPGSSAPLVISAGADHRLTALDPRMSLQAVHVFEEHRDHVYSLTAIGDLCVSGGGDGLVLVHSLASGELLYGLGANQAAVRAMHADTNRLVCAGDDGTVISFEYQGGGGGGAIEPPPRRPAAGCAGVAGGFGAAAQRRASSGGKAAAEVDVGDGIGAAPAKPKQMSQAQAYAEKKRLAMEKAERLKAERMRAREEGWVGNGLPAEEDGGGGGGGMFMGGIDGMGMGGGPPPMPGQSRAQQAAQSELDALHALGDKKFGGPRRR